MKKIKTKKFFFNELENELIKYFSIYDIKDILEDYNMFFDEKEVII